MASLTILIDLHETGLTTAFDLNPRPIKKVEGLDHDPDRDGQLGFFTSLFDGLKVYFDVQAILNTELNETLASDALLVVDRPKTPYLEYHLSNDNLTTFLLTTECHAVRPEVYQFEYLNKFTSVISWTQASHITIPLVNGFNKNAVKSLIQTNPPPSRRSNFMGAVSSNKYSNHRLELYTFRKRLYRLISSVKKESFQLRGLGWEYLVLHKPQFLSINRYLNFLFRKMAITGKRLAITNKFEFLRSCRFCLVTENFKDSDGYITEKIFDALASGCVPVYYGSGFKHSIPNKIFIDGYSFCNIRELIHHLDKLTDAEVDEIALAGSDWLLSDDALTYENKTNGLRVAKQVSQVVLSKRNTARKKAVPSEHPLRE